MNSFISNSKKYFLNLTNELLGTEEIQNHPDFFLIQPRPDKLSIGIKEIQDNVKKAYLKPFQAENKVFLIYSANLLTEEAQNSMLKILEEPPINTYFFLHTTNLSEILPTIRSRCQIVWKDLKPRFKEDYPSLNEILFKSKIDRMDFADNLIANSEVPAKTLVENLCDFIIFESEKHDKFVEIFKLSINAKKMLNRNATPRNVLELLFLKLP